MLTRAFRVVAGVVVCAAALVFGSAASASVTVGQLFTPTFGPCAPGTALMASAPGNSYTVPSAGVITSWSFDNGATIVPNLEFKVGRLVSGTDYKIVGTSVAGAQTPNTVATYPTRLPVQAGDVIGEFENGGHCGSAAPPGVTYDWVAMTNQPLDSIAHYDPLTDTWFPVSAAVEPDVDQDGFGDETQDKCPTNAGTQGTCPPPPPAKDATPPSLSATAAKSARLSGSGALAFSMTANETAKGTVTGTISLPAAAKTVRFTTKKITLAAGKLTKITLKLSRSNLRAVRKALRHHSLKAKITVAVKDASGNQTVSRLTTKLKH